MHPHGDRTTLAGCGGGLSIPLDGNDDLEDIRRGLRAETENLCRALLGEPSIKLRHEWRWGKGNGSFAVVITGRKRGLWNERASDVGGDLLDLIRREKGGDFREVLDWARGFLGMAKPEGWQPHQRRERPEEEVRAEREAEQAERDRKKGVAVRLWEASVSLAGTPAELYLTETRKIPRPAPGWPSAVRFHPGRCALVLAATTAAGDVQAVQLVHLTKDGQKRIEEDRPTKQSFGPQDGAVVRLGGNTEALLLAEGPETGLSLWASTGRETWIALGSVSKVQPPALRRLVVCADDDPRNAPAAKAVSRAVSAWRKDSWDVAVATPWNPRRFDKSDFNDLLRDKGPLAVRTRIKVALQPQGPQPPGSKVIPAPLARHRLGEAVRDFFGAARKWDPNVETDDTASRLPPVHGIQVGVGLGKSTAARREAALMLAEMRAKGDRRTIVMAVPTHALGNEQAAAFNALPEAQAAGLTAAVWRGREAIDPDAPRRPDGTPERMCLDLEAVDEVKGLGVPIEQAVCHKKGSNPPCVCPLYGLCGYQRQKKADADLWFVAHEIIFHEKPAALGKVAVLIVDEAIWTKGLEGVDGSPIDVSLDALWSGVKIPNDLAGHDTARLQHIHTITRRALDAHPNGPLERQRILDAGLTRDTGNDGYILSWRRLVDHGLLPGLSGDARRELAKKMAENRTAMRLGRFFTTLAKLLADDGPEASGWAHLAEVESENGPQRVLRLRGKRSVTKGWLVPTLHLDALLSPDLLRPYWPQIRVTAEIEAQAPHQRIRQLHGRDWAKSALVPDKWCNPAEAERRERNSDRLRAAVWREVRLTPGRALVVAQLAVEDRWRDHGFRPRNAELAHHNNVAGRDEWGPGPGRDGVRRLFVIGRTLPKPGAVERMAEALTGCAVTDPVARYDRQDAAIHLADGTAVSVEADRHPHPIAEAIRWQICEGELIQILGRPRGVNRTAANPVEILLLTDRPLPIVVDEVVAWDSLVATPVDHMLAEGGVALASPYDASRAFPNLWSSPEAAKKAFQRERYGTNPYKVLSIGECPVPLGWATYQVAGNGKKPSRLLFDPALVSADRLRGWLEARLGPLAFLELDPPPAPQPFREEEKGLHTGNTLDTAEGIPGDVGSADTAPKTVRLRTFDAAPTVWMTVPGRLEGEEKSGTPPPADASHWRTIIQTDGLPGD